MSILQEYEEIRKDMGATRYDAIGDYLNEVNKNLDSELFLSDVLKNIRNLNLGLINK